MRSPEHIFNRLKSWSLSESKILISWESPPPLRSFSFEGYVLEAEAPDLRLVGFDKKTEARATLVLDSVSGWALEEHPARVHVDFRSGAKLMVSLAPDERPVS